MTRVLKVLLSLIVALGVFSFNPAYAQARPAGTGDEAIDPPFELTEDPFYRERCDDYEPRRQALFGTTHLHTGLSFDASIRFVDFATGNTPRRAYAFAKGEASMPLPSPSGFQLPEPLRNPMIDRPLDWGAVTDHSEHFGEMGFCKNFMGKDIPERISMECRMINAFFYAPGRALNPFAGRTLASNAFTQLTITSLGAISRNTHLPVCEANPELCEMAELQVWEEHQNAAEEAYDRTSDCSFTSFVAYENTSSPLLNNWHRNVIFRNDRVVKKPVNSLDMAVRPNTSPTTGGPDGVGEPIDTLATVVPADPRVFPVPPGTIVDHPLPQPFWNKLEADCTFGRNVTDGVASRCDFITIPHNTNLGGGLEIQNEDGPVTVFPPLFLDPYNELDAKRHAEMEPLVEIYQDKGSSECRYDPRFGTGTDTVDEFCAFEILDSASLGSASGVGGIGGGNIPPPEKFGNRSYVRNIWKDGIQFAQNGDFNGVNPFKMGVVAASDSHTGVMGWHPENEDWPGHLGIDDAYPMSRVNTIQNSTGGHSVVWAEENSRDSIFEALKRKETYGTSGTRPLVRFFGGWDFPANSCARDLVDIGYQDGVPMGGDLPPRTDSRASPRFIAAAWRDDFIQTNLQQIQIVKGWVDENGETHEAVYRVAGRPGDALHPEKHVDERTCQPRRGLGQERLCKVWEDPDFDPDQHAFYYVRVLEEPVCRYSTLWCRERIGVDPLDTEQCRTDLEALRNGNPLERLRATQGAECCLSNEATETEHFIQPVIQERAWTSPIWYDPSA